MRDPSAAAKFHKLTTSGGVEGVNVAVITVRGTTGGPVRSTSRKEPTMRRSMWMMLGSGLLVAALSTGAQAQISARLFEGIELTDEQQARLTEMREQHQQAAETARAEMIKARAELDALMVVSDLDIAAIERAMRKVSDLQVADRVRALRNQEQRLSIFTEEQRARIDALRGRAASRGGMGRAAGGRTGIRQGRGSAVRGRGLGIRQAPGRPARGSAGRAIPPQAGFGRGVGRNIPPQAGFGLGTGRMAPGSLRGQRAGRFGPPPTQPQGQTDYVPMRMRARLINPDPPPPPPAA